MMIYVLAEDSVEAKKIELELGLNPKYSFESILLNTQSIEITLNYLEQQNIFSQLNENTFFIAQGIACQALMRFLSNNFKEIKNKRIGGIIFINAWLTIETQNEVLKEWSETPIDYQTLFKIIPYKKFTVFLNIIEDREYIKNIWEQRLEAEVVFIESLEKKTRLVLEKLSQWIEN